MSKTKRVYKDGACHRAMKNRPHKVEKANINDIAKDEQVPIKNRTLGKATPEPWDDLMISALDETKYIWKNGLQIEKEDDGCYNILFADTFICNLNKQELKMFPWTTYLPLTSPPNLSKYRLV